MAQGQGEDRHSLPAAPRPPHPRIDPQGRRETGTAPVLGLTHRAEGIHQQDSSLWLKCKPQSGAAQRRSRGSGLTGLVNAWSLQVKPGLAPPVADAPRELCVSVMGGAGPDHPTCS